MLKESNSGWKWQFKRVRSATPVDQKLDNRLVEVAKAVANMQSAANSSEIANGRSSRTERDSIAKYMETDIVLPSAMICRLNVPLYYGNAEPVMNEILSIVNTPALKVRWFILQFKPTEDVDYFAAKMLMELADRLGREQVALVFAELSADLWKFLSDSGVLEVVGSGRVFASVDSALAACQPCKLTPCQG